MIKRYTSLLKNWAYYSLFIAFVFSSSTNLQAQTAPAKQWDRSYGGGVGSYGLDFKSLQQTIDGGYILGGWFSGGIGGDKTQPSLGMSDYWIVKIDANGNKLWDKTFGGSMHDYLKTVQQTSDGGFILGGSTDSPLSGDKSQPGYGIYEDYWIVKVDSLGNKMWDKTFGGYARDRFESIQQTADGGYLVGGTSSSGISGNKTQPQKGLGDYWILKLDSNGNKIWDKAYGGNGEEELYALQQTADGGYILGGTSGSGISGDKSMANKIGRDYWIIKLDANGNKTWDKSFGGSSGDYLSSMQQTTDGGYILGGTSFSPLSGDKSQPYLGGGGDYWVVRIDAQGNKLWDKTFGGDELERLYCVKQTSDGGYLLGGETRSSINGDVSEPNRGYPVPPGDLASPDYWTIKLDAYGNKVWDKIWGGIGGNDFDQLYSLQQTSDGGYILGGTSGTFIGGDKSQSKPSGGDFWIIKLAPPCAPVPVVTNGISCGAQSVMLSATGAPPNGSYAWYTGSSGGNPIYTSTSGVFGTPVLYTDTAFFVAIVNSAGCESQRVAVTATVQPELQVSLGNNIEACEGSEIRLKPQGNSGTYLWSDGSKDSTLIVRSSGKYWVKVFKNGCLATDTIQITFRSCLSTLPNIVTPNNDGRNETFKISALPAGNWQLQIFNRWGIQLFEAEGYQNSWPNSNVADGTYYYLLKNAETRQLYKGWVEVVH